MYNYRMELSTDEEVLNNVISFCNNEHTEIELLQHVRKTLTNLFALHECSLFSEPSPLNPDTWGEILTEYTDYLNKYNIVFPTRHVVGPGYHKANKDYGVPYWKNDDKHITRPMPLFFGIKYMENAEDVKKIWQGRSPDAILDQHRMLYDILYSVCHADEIQKKYRIEGSDITGYYYAPPSFTKDDIISVESKSELYDKLHPVAEKNNALGHLVKRSIFRFDDRAIGLYHEAFDQIRRELIYRIAEDTSRKKLIAAMELEKHTAQMRNLAFSLIEQLMEPAFDGKLPIEKPNRKESGSENKYYDRLYDYIIKRCDNLKVIEVKKNNSQADDTVFPVNMEIRDSDAVLYYAYIFFSNLATLDYLKELRLFFSNDKSKIDPVIHWRNDYISIRNPYLLKVIKNDKKTDKHQSTSIIPYDTIDTFIDDNWASFEEIIWTEEEPDEEIVKMASKNTNKKDSKKDTKKTDKKVAKIDPDKFFERHKDNIKTFVQLYRKICQATHIKLVSLLDLMHLYVRLKRSKILIPVASAGYNKTNPPKPVQIDMVMKNIQEEWDKRKNGEEIAPDLYMKNRISETWLSATMYMAINGMSSELFLKRLEATEKLFYALVQRIPPLTKQENPDVNYDGIIKQLLFA